MACTIKEKPNSKQAGYRRGGKEDVSAGLWGRHGETEQLQAETDCLMLLNHSPVGSIQAVWGVTKACQQSAMAWMYCLALAAKVSQQWLLVARMYLFSSETCFFFFFFFAL